MARPLRIDLPGGWYHVMSRGLERRQILAGEQANLRFVELLSKLPDRFGLRIHGYALMGNHYHLQIETPKANLSQAIQWLNVSYSTWYNRLNRRVGPLLQGRFKAVLHDYQSAALTINRYIHLNPVRITALGGHEGRGDEQPASLTQELIKARVAALDYRWSSYNVYTGKIRNPGWITTAAIHQFFGDHTLQSLRGAYRRQLEEMAALGRWETAWKNQIRATVLLGSALFIRQMSGRLTGKRNEHLGLRQLERAKLDWPAICAAVASVWREDWDEISTTRGNGALAAAWYLGRNFGGMRLGEMGNASGGVAYPAVSAALKRFEKRLRIDRELQKKMRIVRTMLKV